jgi:hypothetical protein
MAKIKKDDTVLVSMLIRTASLLKVLTAYSVTPKSQQPSAASKLAESLPLKHRSTSQMSLSLMAKAKALALAFAKMKKARMFAFLVAPERTSNVNNY